MQTLIRLLRIANSVDPDQIAENGSNVDPEKPTEKSLHYLPLSD